MIGHKFQSDEQLSNNIVRNLPPDIFTPGCCVLFCWEEGRNEKGSVLY